MSVLWLACLAAFVGHNPDTSYARIEIRRDVVETKLTYDVFTLLRIVPLDDNRDGQLSRRELAGHIPEIQEFLARHLRLTVNDQQTQTSLGEFDGLVWPPDAADTIPEADYHAQNGLIHFRFRRSLAEMPERVAIWFDFFPVFGQRHSVIGSFVLENAEEEVLFTMFEPEFTYETGWVATDNAPAGMSPESDERPPPPHGPPMSRRVGQFFRLGVEHIFLGYDHICFLIALIVVGKFREIVKIVTSFTVAHSITLILATLDVVRIPGRWVESGIAATIVYVALANLWTTDTRHRWRLTFVFGLIHGFGFANVLRETGLPTIGLIRCLISFNVGVEAGQLVIATALMPVALGLARWRHGRVFVIVISIVLALFGTAWLLDRALALAFMPF